MPDPISWGVEWPYIAAALAGGYLFGSVPFGLILTRLFGLGDLRQIGSGNIGATNVLRTGRKDLALATLLLDSSKGAVAALAALFLAGPQAMFAAGLAAVLGHNFPVWLRFKGGKGVATTLGTLIAVAWDVGLATCAAWLVVAALFRSSAWFLYGDPQLVEFCAILAVLAWIRHHTNIRRLLKGEEPRIGAKKK